MAQYRHHFFPLAIFTPAHLAVQLLGGESQLLSQVQHIGQAPVDLSAIGMSAAVIGIDAGNLNTALQSGDEIVLGLLDVVTKLHGCSSLQLFTGQHLLVPQKFLIGECAFLGLHLAHLVVVGVGTPVGLVYGEGSLEGIVGYHAAGV